MDKLNECPIGDLSEPLMMQLGWVDGVGVSRPVGPHCRATIASWDTALNIVAHEKEKLLP